MLKLLSMHFLCLLVALVFLPAALAGNWWHWDDQLKEQSNGKPAGESNELDGGTLLRIYLTGEQTAAEMELEDYLVGVVAAEMPASFHLEALKAQAVVARTYALRKMTARGGSGCRSHPGADLCTDSTCCQAWEKGSVSLEKWPPGKDSFYLQRIREAVSSTRGLVITFEQELAEAVYHSTCGGMTEAASDAWSGGGSPYLQAVECTYCSHSTYYRRETAMPLTAYAAAFKMEKEALPVLGEGNVPLLEVTARSKSGRNLLLELGAPGRTYSGNEMRNFLGLPSTHFHWRVEGNSIVFSTRGHGHGVGMCQYGADGMAAEGHGFIEILEHYYGGVTVEEAPPLGSGTTER